ncbi:aromatic prenyltransferase [Clohesyomyces aquaticus]|uniref:Aromatic prenyltransferase n=1 Tax=Clohesyomyces aquaticus TaxID=1231657 RepID=A0A1Y1ZUL7_9PLEO|nr:aromatic prenyltransferase [Clohesyomyces aquaticus]
MMLGAGYPELARDFHAQVFNDLIVRHLGTHPKDEIGNSGPNWTSYMNDDYTPIEFSWNWAGPYVLPKVRYAIEPIGPHTGTTMDPFNSTTADQFVHQLTERGTMIDLTWYHHLNQTLAKKAESPPATESGGEMSSKFLALELGTPSHQSIKAYFILPENPSQDDSQLCTAISTLPSAGASIHESLQKVQLLVSTLRGQTTPKIEMIGIDCIPATEARIKIYIRSPETSFDSVLKMMMLPGKGRSDERVSSLRDLWQSVLGLEDHFDGTHSLPSNSHRTSGIIYHYDLRLSSTSPKVKLYIPVKHYGGTDFKAAEGFSKWLHRNGYKLQASSYLEAVQHLCKHRTLQDGLGFQTYISASLGPGGLSVTAYFCPETYSRLRV